MYFGDIPEANKQFLTNLVNTGTPAELQALARGNYTSLYGRAPYDVYTIPDPSKITNATQMVSWANNPNTNLQDSSGNSMTGQAQPGGTYWVPKENIGGAVTADIIHKDSGLLGNLGSLALGIGGNMLLPGLGSALGGGLLGAAGAGAIIGGGASALTGGNVLKGAALGGLGAGVGSYVGSNFSTNPAKGFAGVSPAQFASTVGKAGIGMLGGAPPSQALTGGLASLAGTSAASNFDNPWLKNLAGGTVSTAVRGGNTGDAALNSLLGTTSRYAASKIDNPFLSGLVASSPRALNQLQSQRNQVPQVAPRPAPQTMNQPPAWVNEAMVVLGKKGYSEQQAKQIIQQHGRG